MTEQEHENAIDRVLRFLRQNAGEAYRAKAVADHTGLPANTVRGALGKLRRDDMISSPKRGLYQTI